MPSTIFAGSKVKTLKSTLSLNGGPDIISSSTDPTTSAVDASAGSLLLNTTSGKQYRKNDSGSTTNWTEVGSGSGVKNYIQKGTFDSSSTAGWSVLHSTVDATTRLPNQSQASWVAAVALSLGSVGGSAQLSLSGYSLSLNSAGSVATGDMLVSDAITLDQEAQASVQTFSFFYKVNSGAANCNFSGTSANSFGVAIYDVTNSAWIQPAGVFNVIQSSGVAKCAVTFQVPVNTTSVRAAFYIPNATAGAISVYLDDFVLGPQAVQYGAPVTDWQSYTPAFTASTTSPTLGSGGNFNQTGRWRRIGDTMQIQTSFTWGTTSATFGSGTYRIGLPTGYAIDPSKVATPGTGGIYALQGQASYWDASPGTGASDLILQYDGTGTSYVQLSRLGGGSNVNATSPITWATGDTINTEFFVPIAGWASSVSMSNDTDTRVVAASYSSNSAQTMASTGTFLDFAVKNFDTHNAVLGAGSGPSATYTATWRYVVPVSGIYRATAKGYTAANPISQVIAFSFYKNNVLVSSQRVDSAPSGTRADPFISALISANAGDILSFAGAPGSSSVATGGDPFNDQIFIERLSGPSAIAATETVASVVNGTPTGTISSAVATSGNAVFPTVVKDTHNAYSSGVYTIPVSGTYSIEGSLNITGTSASSYLDTGLMVNGSVVEYDVNVLPSGTGVSFSVRFKFERPLLAGTAISVRPQTNMTTTSYSANGRLIINRIGNY